MQSVLVLSVVCAMGLVLPQISKADPIFVYLNPYHIVSVDPNEFYPNYPSILSDSASGQKPVTIEANFGWNTGRARASSKPFSVTAKTERNYPGYTRHVSTASAYYYDRLAIVPPENENWVYGSVRFSIYSSITGDSAASVYFRVEEYEDWLDLDYSDLVETSGILHREIEVPFLLQTFMPFELEINAYAMASTFITNQGRAEASIRVIEFSLPPGYKVSRVPPGFGPGFPALDEIEMLRGLPAVVIPEPSSWLLALCGLAGLITLGRMRSG